MPMKTVTNEVEKVLTEAAGDVLLTLDLKQRRIGIDTWGAATPTADQANQAVIIPEVEARENYDFVYRFLKRTIDVIFAASILIVASPLILVVGILIKLSSQGPVFYRQERTGKYGKRFDMYKFRTMRNGSESLKRELKKSSHLKWPDFKVKNDPRVTRIGNVLRKLSMDEIPNFINVLKGEMSLVGPRPTSFRSEAYKDWQKLRLRATPGLTGLQQVSGRANLQFDERVLLDIKYVLYQSITLDLYILIRTIFVVLSMKGSY